MKKINNLSSPLLQNKPAFFKNIQKYLKIFKNNRNFGKLFSCIIIFKAKKIKSSQIELQVIN